MSANDKLADLQVQHALHLLRYGNGVNRDIQKLLAGLERDVAEKLAQRIATIEERGHDLGPTVTKRLNQTLDEIRALNGAVYGKVEAELTDQLEKLAKTEIKYGADALRKATGIKTSAAVASPERLRAIVVERPIQGKLLSSFVKGAEAGTLDRVEGVIRSGMATGQTVDQMVKAIRGTKAANYADGTMATSRRSAEAIVRTSVTHVANSAQMESFKRNSNIIRGWQFVATLDSRTTLICAAHDSEIYPLGEGPMPPLHPNCRSTITAVTKSFDEMGLDRKDYTADQRASLDGQITNPGNFEKWLKSKDEAFQNGLLGKTRADLWRDGKFSLSDFVKDRNTVISLDELTAKNTTLTAVAEEPALKAFTPVNIATTNGTISVQPRMQVQKSLTTHLKASAADTRHLQRVQYKAVKTTDWGKASFSTAFDDEAVSAISAVMPELDAICDRFDVPRVRGLKTIKARGVAANMGDATMGLNADAFNRYAAGIGKKDIAVDLAKYAERRDALSAEMKAIAADMDEVNRQRREALRAERFDEYDTLTTEQKALVKRYNDLHSQYAEAFNRARSLEVIANEKVSDWKPGDDVKTRPHVAAAYFESGVDKVRSILYHETAHTVHQTYRQTVSRMIETPILERRITDLWTEARRDSDWKSRQPTNYATTNQFEWFAENFALYMLGRMDLVDPTLIKFIEGVLNETAK